MKNIILLSVLTILSLTFYSCETKIPDGMEEPTKDKIFSIVGTQWSGSFIYEWNQNIVKVTFYENQVTVGAFVRKYTYNKELKTGTIELVYYFNEERRMYPFIISNDYRTMTVNNYGNEPITLIRVK